ncbi:Cyclin-dependent kinase 20 [Manis javanica]|nr:Cyclin-dependent kinase 20 [Manis javanica]
MRPRPGRCNPARPCLRSPASHACHGVALVVRWECGGRGSGRHCCLAAALPLSWRGAHLPIEAHRGVTAGAQRRVQTRSRREPQLPTAARVRTASSSRDWRDRCPQEGGSAAAGGWHPPNQVLREIKALQEMEDNQYMSLGPAGALPPVPSTPAHCSLPDRVPRGLSLCAGGQLPCLPTPWSCRFPSALGVLPPRPTRVPPHL